MVVGTHMLNATSCQKAMMAIIKKSVAVLKNDISKPNHGLAKRVWKEEPRR